jgi:hypothetical protein
MQKLYFILLLLLLMSCNKTNEKTYGFCAANVGCCSKIKWDKVGYTLTDCRSENIKEILNATNIVIYE